MASASAAPIRNIVVTGGSRGLGLAVAEQLAAAGHRSIAVARTRSKELSAAMAKAGRDGPGALHFLPCDLGRIEGIPALLRTVRKEFGPLYGLVNNAALGFDGALALMNDARIAEMVRVNTLSPIVMSKYAVRTMMADGAGRIVNIASIVVSNGYSGLSAYAATKASLIGLTRSLAREVGRYGITVNAVAPGFLSTEMTQGLAADDRQRVIRRSALRRLAEVGDVADAVEYLLSEKARNISGTVLTVDAGATA
jgi:3-oxoacyl-[acyl-carrier protein] reductase